jgi:hypothetical protein
MLANSWEIPENEGRLSMKVKWQRLAAIALMAAALPSLGLAKPVTREDLVNAQSNAGEWLS